MYKKSRDYPYAGEELPIFAAIDLGTNNCRLMIARPLASSLPTHSSIKLLDSFSKIVRLGEGLASHKRLQPEAIARTIHALEKCRHKIDRFSVTKQRFVTTEACRQAENASEFLHLVKEKTGLDIEIITTEEEAKLAFLACSPLLLPESEHALVFDIGGGSTEFLWVKRVASAEHIASPRHQILDWLSLNKGVMNLSEQFGGSGFVEIYFEEMVKGIIEQLSDFESRNQIGEHLLQGNVQILSTSGTLTTIAAIHLHLHQYERAKVDGVTFAIADLRNSIRTILAMRPSERFANGCIGPERIDYIISGCAIFEAICRLWNMQTITVADRGVREGIIISLMQEYSQWHG